MNMIVESYKKYPMSWIYALLGGFSLAIGIATMDGFIELKEDLMIMDVYGFCILIFSSILIVTAFLMYRIDKIARKVDRIELDDRLQDLQQEENP